MSQTKIKNRIDLKMLTATLAVQTYSGDDDAMLVYIKEQLKFLNVNVQEDSFGNIYVTKGESKNYPCAIAHTDTVQPVINQMEIYKTGDTLFAFNPATKHQYGIGGDDKVGVYILLQLLIDVPVMKGVFFREEEVGCKGSHYAISNHKEWFDDCSHVMSADRRGNQDIITVSGNLLITSDKYLEATQDIHDKHNYKECIGLSADVNTLASGGIGISCTNYSSGYWEPHSNKETISIKDVNNCYSLMYDVATMHPLEKFSYCVPITPARKYYSRYHGRAKESYSSMADFIGPHTPIQQRQGKFKPPLYFGKDNRDFENFIEVDIMKHNKKIYNYRGIRAIVFTGDAKCKKCSTEIVDNYFFLPYEGRIFCTKCNGYVNEAEVPGYLKFLETEDKGTTFVYSLYANGWLFKQNAVWRDKLQSWVPDELPF